jgi:hypothetical protein
VNVGGSAARGNGSQVPGTDRRQWLSGKAQRNRTVLILHVWPGPVPRWITGENERPLACRNGYAVAKGRTLVLPGQDLASVFGLRPAELRHSSCWPTAWTSQPCPRLGHSSVRTTVEAQRRVGGDPAPGPRNGLVDADSGDAQCLGEGVHAHVKWLEDVFQDRLS